MGPMRSSAATREAFSGEPHKCSRYIGRYSEVAREHTRHKQCAVFFEGTSRCTGRGNTDGFTSPGWDSASVTSST